MACTALTKGRGLDCNRISGGIKNVYFGVYDQFSPLPVIVSERLATPRGVVYLYRVLAPISISVTSPEATTGSGLNWS